MVIGCFFLPLRKFNKIFGGVALKKIFVNKNGQMRSGWKITILIAGTFVITLLLSFLAFFIIGLIGGYLKYTAQKLYLLLMVGEERFYLFTTISFLSTVIMITLMLKFIDKKKFKDIGFTSLKYGYKNLIVGFLIGAFSIAIIVLILYILGAVTIERNSNISAYYLLWGMYAFILVGLEEELMSRGYFINALNQMERPWVSVLISSIIFSLMHILNPNIVFLGLLNIFLIGVLFSYMYLKTGNLWMPIGYHISWNYFQGYIFGFNVSGNAIRGIYNAFPKNNFLSGGDFGLEGGIIATLVILITFLILYYYFERYRKVQEVELG
ncbi:metal-dependent membrane protease [Caldanaerobacter subterraneus subsp. pacificus DSM 12653]|uniref:Metal-dependent membrane protease n=1 Tax=Caldanaerobacter subterraneus subsp. pacificus DSM 12653 TaxID=391606 RepID=A0A0F5PPF8_9THEO|nr:metal-dependent membrane protease [Caldanaerobacter subterraneus subsp. pacificus DSM 12653]